MDAKEKQALDIVIQLKCLLVQKACGGVSIENFETDRYALIKAYQALQKESNSSSSSSRPARKN